MAHIPLEEKVGGNGTNTRGLVPPEMIQDNDVNFTSSSKFSMMCCYTWFLFFVLSGCLFLLLLYLEFCIKFYTVGAYFYSLNLNSF